MAQTPGTGTIVSQLAMALDDIEMARAMIRTDHKEQAQSSISRIESVVHDTIEHLVTGEEDTSHGSSGTSTASLPENGGATNRTLFSALEAAVLAAEDVNTEQGLSVPESNRTSSNNTLGEEFDQIHERVRGEVHGARGRD